MDTYGFLDSSQVNTERLPGVSDTFVEFKSLATPAIPATAVAAGSESRAATPLRSEAVRARLEALAGDLENGTISPVEYNLRAARLEAALAPAA